MSFEKINGILGGGNMIDARLVSDQLSTILTGIIDAINKQDSKFDQFQLLLNQKANKSDLNDISSNIVDSTNNMCRKMIEEAITPFTNSFQIVKERTQQIEDTIISDLTSKINNVREELENRINIVDTNQSLTNTQFVEAIKQTREVKDLVTNIKTEQAECLRRVKIIEDSSDKTLQKQITSTNDRIDEVLKLFPKQKSEFEIQINQLRDKHTEKLTKLESHQAEMHKKIVDLLAQSASDTSITAEILGETNTVDQQMLIRAIQRDSRRIDKLNEMLATQKTELEDRASFTSSLSNCLHEIVLTLTTLTNDFNDLKSILPDSINSNTKVFQRIFKYLNTLVDSISVGYNVSMQSSTEINNALLQVHSILRQISGSALPHYKPVDEVISSYQKVYDDIVKLSENLLAEDTFAPPISLSQSPQPSIKIPTVTVAKGNGEEPEKEAPSTAEMELRQQLASLNERLNSEAARSAAFRMQLDAVMERKADSQVVERMMDKVRANLVTLRDRIGETARNQANMLSRDEAASLVKQGEGRNAQSVFGQSNYGVRSPGKNSKSSGKLLPPLSPHAVHDVIYKL